MDETKTVNVKQEKDIQNLEIKSKHTVFRLNTVMDEK